MTLTPAEQTFLAEVYGWEVVKVATLYEGENHTYAVTIPEGEVVVRRYRASRYTPAEVAAELEWLAALAGSVPVVPALQHVTAHAALSENTVGQPTSLRRFPTLRAVSPTHRSRRISSVWEGC